MVFAMNQSGHLLLEMQIDGLDFDMHAVLADDQFVLAVVSFHLYRVGHPS